MEIQELINQLINDHAKELALFRETQDTKYLHWLLSDAIDRARALPKECDMTGFMKSLTGNESYVFDAIVKKIGTEGNISIIKMIEETGCSRPVFTSLLAKMEKYEVAFVKNQGVKGTYICLKMGK